MSNNHWIQQLKNIYIYINSFKVHTIHHNSLTTIESNFLSLTKKQAQESLYPGLVSVAMNIDMHKSHHLYHNVVSSVPFFRPWQEPQPGVTTCRSQPLEMLVPAGFDVSGQWGTPWVSMHKPHWRLSKYTEFTTWRTIEKNKRKGTAWTTSQQTLFSTKRGRQEYCHLKTCQLNLQAAIPLIHGEL